MKEPSSKSTQTVESNVECQYVALRLGDEVYGVDIACIHSVLMPQDVTTVPQTPEYVQGIMNLRGQIVPVIDLRIRFGLPVEKQPKMRVVIVNVQGVTAGLTVDAVSEVLRIRSSDIDPPPVLLSSLVADCITGVGRLPSETDPNRLILLLDVNRLITSSLSSSDIATLAA
jgi:purine-binding chemotaxis protein CheW